MSFCVKSLSFSYRSDIILHDITLELNQGQRWAIIGKNGAGKTTLVKCMAGLLKGYNGSICYNDN
ncbi:MAG: ATP-binding cassette domain-containing protein, partial [Chitinivibrionales bacterium]